MKEDEVALLEEELLQLTVKNYVLNPHPNPSLLC